MNITLEEIKKVNRSFGGRLLSDSSIDLALSRCKTIKSEYRQAALLIRVIIVDHPFSDANKRTSLYVLGKFFPIKDQEKVANAIIRIAKESIVDIDKIVEVIKNANR